ncbi:MAG: hypothetical protein JXR77_02405 [Lentisphaeria bacterium]|nr:hypothetical protein [Lentisphaeria bacterium]
MTYRGAHAVNAAVVLAPASVRVALAGRVVVTFALLSLGGISMLPCSAAPRPGDVFREYTWFHRGGDAGEALRVGKPGIGPDYATESIRPGWDVDLDGLVRAEMILEKILCHDGTRGLALQLNQGPWLALPEAPGIPEPAEAYQHHTYPVVPLEPAALRWGTENTFRLRVAPEHPWKWPQNLVNGVHLRLYCDPARKPGPTGQLEGVRPGSRLGAQVTLRCTAESPNGPIASVAYIAFCTDVNFEGDGVFRQWHGHYDHGRFVTPLGTATAAPFEVTWDTSWLPDQAGPMQLSARVTDAAGLTAMLAAVGDLALDRDEVSVELCELRDVPQRWVTRRGELSEIFLVRGDPAKAVSAQLAWCSWSPGYMNGIAINGVPVFDREGPKYQAFWHRVTLRDVAMLRGGENILTTGETPRRDGRMVHGMEVNWPGIMVLVKYRK